MTLNNCSYFNDYLRGVKGGYHGDDASFKAFAAGPPEIAAAAELFAVNIRVL